MYLFDNLDEVRLAEASSEVVIVQLSLYVCMFGYLRKQWTEFSVFLNFCVFNIGIEIGFAKKLCIRN